MTTCRPEPFADRTAIRSLGKLFCSGLLLLGACQVALADDAADCQANAGTLLVGQVVKAPRFVSGKFLHGVELSHTHIQLRGDQDGKIYDVAVDNVFATGYRKNAKQVPAPLNTIKVGTHLEACGQPFNGGIHWVHTNCGDSPTASDPNGWVRVLAADGTPGPNMEASQTYCKLWPSR